MFWKKEDKIEKPSIKDEMNMIAKQQRETIMSKFYEKIMDTIRLAANNARFETGIYIPNALNKSSIEKIQNKLQEAGFKVKLDAAYTEFQISWK